MITDPTHLPPSQNFKRNNKNNLDTAQLLNYRLVVNFWLLIVARRADG
jgi:hypothetical protein